LEARPAAALHLEVTLQSFTDLVTLVVDGDTFKTRLGATIRLAGVDCPEISQLGGTLAKSQLKSLIEGKLVTIYPVARDDYGRIVADVWDGTTCINDITKQHGC